MSRTNVQVEVKKAGDGVNYPKKGRTVVIHYSGFLADGTRFDSTRDRGKPFRFKLGAAQVVPGLDMGVVQLSVGERANLSIPSHLAWGDKGFPGLIPPNSDLVFDVELLSFS
jgi:FK506-binding protein 1